MSSTNPSAFPRPGCLLEGATQQAHLRRFAAIMQLHLEEVATLLPGELPMVSWTVDTPPEWARFILEEILAVSWICEVPLTLKWNSGEGNAPSRSPASTLRCVGSELAKDTRYDTQVVPLLLKPLGTKWSMPGWSQPLVRKCSVPIDWLLPPMSRKRRVSLLFKIQNQTMRKGHFSTSTFVQTDSSFAKQQSTSLFVCLMQTRLSQTFPNGEKYWKVKQWKRHLTSFNRS